MQINRSLLPKAGSRGIVAKAGNSFNKSGVALAGLTKDLAATMNEFIGIPSNKPLTIQTLDQVQTKFWPSPDENLCTKLWQMSENLIKEVLENQDIKNAFTVNQTSRKSPVVFSTREGIDIVVALASNEDKLSAVALDVSPGGSSINVARALNNFGTKFELVGICGDGPKGKLFAEALEKEGINSESLLKVQNDIRMHFSTAINGNEYWLVSQSPVLNDSELDKFTSDLFKVCKKQEKEVLVLANSQPTGAPENYMPEVIKKAQDKFGMFVVYDTKLHGVTDEVVSSVLDTGPGMIKPNLDELGRIVKVDSGKLRHDKDLIVHLAQELIHKYGINLILVSMDKDGAILIDKKRAAYASPPPIVVASPGCAGDTGIAAMIDRAKKRNYSFRYPTDKQFKDFLSAFIAGGSATASKPGSNLGTLEEVEELEKKVKVDFI